MGLPDSKVSAHIIVGLLCMSSYTSAHLPVVISTGAFITPIKGVIIYNDIELLHHVISDLPDPPKSIASPCPTGSTQRSCSLSKHIHKITEDCAAVLSLLNKARTTYGLSEEDLPDVVISGSSFRRVVEKETRQDPPPEELVKKVGRLWYDQVRDRLNERVPSPELNGTTHTISKRWVQYIPKLVMGGAALLGLDDLVDMASSLFVGENGILRFLTTLEATSPEKSFMDLSRRVSEFEAQTRALTGDIALEAQRVQQITNFLQKEVAQHKMDIATVVSSFFSAQQMLSDVATLLFSYAVYFATMDADGTCRGGYLSPIMLPQQLLAQKLTDIATVLPPDLKLAVGLDRIQTYYTTKSASCLYDSMGGLITVQVPLVYKAAQYQMYEYRNVFYAWDDLTCTLDSQSRYVIKDLKNNLIYPIDSVDEERCSPHTTRKCLVPPISDNSESVCLTQLLSSSTVSEIRESCKMSCFRKRDTYISQFQSNVFIAVHVPSNALTIECPNHETFNVTDEVKYGSIRIILPCICTVKLNQKTVGRSSGPICEGHEAINVDILLPGHLTTLTDYLPFTQDGSVDGTKFSHHSEILNMHFMDDLQEEDSVITTDVSVVSVVWNFTHSVILAYLLFKMNLFTGARAITGLSAIQMADASDFHYCKIENELYYMIYVIIGLCTLSFVPPMLWKIYTFFGRQFWQAVDVATDRRVANGIM